MKIQVFLKLSQNSAENTCVGKHLQRYLKETPTQVFSWKTFKSTFFYRTSPVAAF